MESKDIKPINYENYGQPYVQFLSDAKVAMEYGRPELLRDVFARLPLLKLDEGYMLDSYQYYHEYIHKRSRRKRISYRYFVYVRKIKAKRNYKPKLKRSISEVLLNKKPDEIQFTNTEYREDMIIKDPLYTKKCIESIPRTINYITCPFTKDGIWQMFMYFILLNEWFGEIIFSEKDIERFNKPKDYKGGYVFKQNDFEKIKSLKIVPDISINGSLATLNLAMLFKNKIVLFNYEFVQKDNKLDVVKGGSKIIAELESNEQERIYIGSLEY